MFKINQKEEQETVIHDGPSYLKKEDQTPNESGELKKVELDDDERRK